MDPFLPDDNSNYRKLVRYTSFGAAIACPTIILLPPRKFDVYTIALLFGTGFGVNQSVRELTGRSLVTRLAVRMSSMSGAQLPNQRARDVQERLRVEKEARRAMMERPYQAVAEERKKGAVIEAVKEERKRKEGENEKERGVVEKIWMGKEGEDWKAKRNAREKEALDQGRGYGGLILDQIWEVWNWGKDKAEEVKEIDEKAVKEQKEGNK